jgi:hypothetical protein
VPTVSDTNDAWWKKTNQLVTFGIAIVGQRVPAFGQVNWPEEIRR